ncbi:hypothetical protein ONS95_004184 [Cadophora gregata]|uniref:uncharacterized protein n=1 Tax=Cadophora gregata TaxID=51156 RepID=UPI0026DD0208|nr:uncharacterized protein ONS95_004184 [Cadophora gregata]KAK0105449.1 hypothetical protein ONS96_004836 [Cadophora gregata f. sp. sojae]KAK0105656.1 hypothetical protein ONS95_004184 [Cadophora gregata]
MRVSLLLPAAAFFGAALAELDYALLTKFPSCALKCATTVVLPKCNITDLPNCLCKSDDLQYDISTCVVGACNVTDQYASLTILQEGVCKGVPVPSRQAELRRAAIILAAFTYPIIVLRFISRVIIARKVWWDDWTILACVVFMIPMTVLPIYPSSGLGLGKHFYNVPPVNFDMLLKLFYAVQLFYVVVQTLAKMSILLLYLRIFPSQRFRLIIKISMVFMVCHGTAFFFVVAFQCIPVRSIWDRGIAGQCVNSQALIYAGAGFSIFEDFAIMLLPIFELKGLNLSRRKRIALGFMFALGSFACITSIIRIKYVTSYGNTIDETWNYVDVVIWSSIETFTAVICACLMCIRPLIMKYMPGVFPTTINSRNNTNKSWGQKIGSRGQNSRNFGGGIELSGEDRAKRSNPSSQTARSQITVTTESRVSFEAKRASEYTAFTREMADDATISSESPLTHTKR